MMLIPKWGNYPGDGGGGITLVIDIWIDGHIPSRVIEFFLTGWMHGQRLG